MSEKSGYVTVVGAEGRGGLRFQANPVRNENETRRERQI